MSHSVESVLKQLGDGQLVGGAIIVHRGGKNIEVARIDNKSGAFNVTDAGKEILEPVTEPAPRKGGKRTTKTGESPEQPAQAEASAGEPILDVDG